MSKERTPAQLAADQKARDRAAETRAAKENQVLVTDQGNNLQQAAIEGQNSGGTGPAPEAPTVMDASSLNDAKALQNHAGPTAPLDISPLGEARVDRVQPQKTPEWYEVVVERTPADWGLPDQVQICKEKGYEISPGQGTPEEVAKMVRIRMRMPYEDAMRHVREAEIKAEKNRRVKHPDASIDKTERTAIHLQELFTATEGGGSDNEAASRIVSDSIPNPRG